MIEYRLSGYQKDAIKQLKNGISKNFHVTRKKIVPHVTLIGPLYTKDEKRLIKEIHDIGKNYDLVKLRLDDFDRFENRVIYVGIKPSDELKKLRAEMVERLKKFCRLSEHDYERHFTFHATIVLNDIQRKFDHIWEYLQTWKLPKMEQHVLRITIIKNSKILIEYDFLQQKVLNRRESLDRKTFHKTIDKLDKKREPSEIKFEDISNKGKICVFSDAHFDHENIIKKFVFRPFGSTRQMNEELRLNWNKTVKENDTVYFLGDMTWGRNRNPIDFWLGVLNGEVFFIRGNHDVDIITRARVTPDRYGIKYCDYKFLLMHDPHRPFGYDGWIIHGDKHNNNLKDYPFINQKNKTVNVCAELVDYTPISVDTLISLIETGRSYKTING